MIRFLKSIELSPGVVTTGKSSQCRTICTSFGGIFSNQSEEFNSRRLSVRPVYSHVHHGSASVRWASRLSLASIPKPSVPVPESDVKDFMALYPEVVKDLTRPEDFDQVPYVRERIIQMLDYNVPWGKRIRGLSVVASLRHLLPPEELTPETLRLARLVGWALEICQGCYTMVDDWGDQSETRRDRPCWYKIKGNEQIIPIDCLLMEALMKKFLSIHIKDKPYYVNILQLFNDNNFKSFLGETEDIIYGMYKGVEWETFGWPRFYTLSKYKTGYYTFHIPVAAAMYMANVSDPEIHAKAEKVLMEISYYYQAQDDYIDTFGDPALSGKIGTDIQDGKCTWLANTAWDRANADQRRIIKECYGFKDPQKVEKIKQLFRDMRIPDLYFVYEKQHYKDIEDQIQQVSKETNLHPEVFHHMIRMIKKRSR